MREGIKEKLNIGKEEEKAVMEKLKELKEKETERMEEDNTLGPWKNIEPEHLTPEAQELFDLFEKDQLEVVQEKFQDVSSKIEEIKDKKIKSSNENFLHWIDDKVNAEVSKRTLEEQREKENI